MPMNPRLLVPRATGFNPRSIANLGLWLAADDSATITTVSGAVSEWRDKSSGGRVFSQGTPANRPTLEASVFGAKPAVRFNGSNNVLTSAVNAGALAWPSSFFAVVRKPTAQGDGCIFALNLNGSNSFSTGETYCMTTNSNTAAIRVLGGTSTSIFPGVGAVGDTLGSFLVSLTLATSNDAVLQNLTAGQTATDNSYTVSVPAVNNGCSVGMFQITNLGFVHPLAGDIAEVLIYSRVLSASEQRRVEGYLAWKWGLQSQLPYDHPYAKSFPGFGSQTTPTDSDALTYLAAVKAADGTGVEVSVANAVDDFVKGCKQDGIWDAIKASCILMGARTLAGALVPLKGTAPTNVNFVSGDYNRETGLLGNGSNKHLNSNRNANADPQDNFHMSIAVSASGSGISMGAGASNTGATQLSLSDIRCRNPAAITRNVQSTDTGLRAMNRTAGAEFVSRWLGSNETHSVASQTPFNGDIFVFARNSGGAGLYSDMRCYWYSIGESLNLTLLDTRVAALHTAIGAAI